MMADRRPQTNTNKNAKLVADQAPIHNRVEKIISQKQAHMSKMAEVLAATKKQQEEEQERVELTGTEKIIQAKEKKKKE